MTTGISTDDFNQILKDFKRTVSYKIITKIINETTGDETSSFATAIDQDIIFFLEENRYIFDKEGLIQVGDAYVIAPTSLGIKRYDQFTIDGNTYYIENITRKHILNTAMMDYGVCFLVGKVT